ncbi:uncharacterized protein [Haliotis asinina]|uniref:uncharacterized protein n=1 Tax=Haliotis asinina TaxID=109174 RepID=UPI003532197D
MYLKPDANAGVDEGDVSIETLETKYMHFMKDGHSQPVNCTRKQKIAIIIPFRDRHQHLRILLNNLIPRLVKKLLDFTIFVTELVAGVKFNRAMLMNIGFKEAQNHGDFDCFIFHDVDMVPESSLVPYECLTNRSYHLSSSISAFNYTYRPFYAGGVLSFPKRVFEAINGYSNLYFGWGFEDNDVFKRLRFLNGEPLEPPTMFGAFRSLTHPRDDHNEENPRGIYLLFEAWRRARYEGLTSLRYSLEKTEIKRIFIWKTVSYNQDYYAQNSSLPKLNVNGDLRPSSDWQGPMSVDRKTLSDLKAVKGKLLASIIAQTDPKSCSYAPNSKMHLSSSKTDFKLGDTISVTIQLFDEYKRRKTKGGDNVRVWMRETSKEARAAGVVTDNKDGTYTGTLRALWTGSPKLEASIASRKENVDIFYRRYLDDYTLRNISARFESDGVTEETLCLPIPHIQGYADVCNLTAENYGLPWYCGKPSHRKLLCYDLTGLREEGYQSTLFTSHEAKFFKRHLLHQNIPTAVVITVKATAKQETVSLPSVPCNKTPLWKSWEASTPVGFFYKNSWKSLICENTIPADPQIYRKCLKNRRLWIHGDSTSRAWFVNLNKRLGLKLVTEEWDNSKWHKQAVTMDKTWNITLLFVPHEYPFFHGFRFDKLSYNRATHAYLDAIPSTSRDIFLIHIYLHFHSFPPEVFRTHIQRIARSVKSLVTRAPGVKVAIRGTHAFKGRKRIGFLDDCWMFVYDMIQRDAFKGLENNVLFLNNVDLTVATENDDQHPNSLVVDSLINHFMGSVCGGRE